MSKTTVFVTPGKGQDMSELARVLIDLSDDPHAVVWSTRAGAFEVPEQTAQAYAAQVGIDLSQLSPAGDAGEDGGAGGGGEARTVKAKPRAARGRPADEARPRAARARKNHPTPKADTGETGSSTSAEDDQQPAPAGAPDADQGGDQ